MITKFTYYIIALFVTFSFENMAFCQPLINNVYYPQSYVKASASDFDDGDITNSYRYVSFGVGPIIFIPNVGIGYRERHSQLGWDTALSFSTIGYAHQLSAHLVGHYYFSPSRINSAYIGLGLTGSGVLSNDKGFGATLSPDFIFGKELEKNGNSSHFVEMHVAIPTMLIGSTHFHKIYLPLMYVKYGISF